MPDVLKDLIPASWRGIEFPITKREFGFSQEQAQHRYIFRDDQLIESLGRANPTYRYSALFREEIVRGGYENLFTVTYPLFLDACLDRSADILGDPIHGPVQCKLASLAETLDVTRRDGIDVEATFIRAPDEDSQDLSANLDSVEGARGLRDLFERETPELDAETQAKLDALNAGGERAKIDPFQYASSVADQLDANANKFQAQMDQLAEKMGRVADSYERLKEPRLARSIQTARRLALSAKRVALATYPFNQEKKRKLRTHIVQTDIGLIALAGQLNSSVNELTRTNPHLRGTVGVTAGTQVFYFV